MIQLQFVAEDSYGSKAIAWFSQGHLSHVDAVIPTSTLSTEPVAWGLLGARSDGGVLVRAMDYDKFSRKVVFSLPADDEKSDAFHRFLIGQIGKPYDSKAIWGFVTGRDWREPDSWICSELQAAALEYAKIIPPLFLAANKITPVMLAVALSAIGAEVKES